MSFFVYPDPREDPKNRSLKGVPIKYPLVVRVPNWGIYFLDPPGGLGIHSAEPSYQLLGCLEPHDT